jgi:hypothetical protein
MLRLITWKVRCWWQRVRYGVITVGTPRLKPSSEPRKHTPVIDLVRHRKTGQVFLVEHAPYARVPGVLTPFGEPLEIPKEDLAEALLPAVVSALEAFEKRGPVDNAMGPENDKLHRSRSVQWLSVSREEPSLLIVWPIHRKSGGIGEGVPDEKVKVPLPCSGQEFLSVVDAAWCESGASLVG